MVTCNEWTKTNERHNPRRQPNARKFRKTKKMVRSAILAIFDLFLGGGWVGLGLRSSLVFKYMVFTCFSTQHHWIDPKHHNQLTIKINQPKDQVINNPSNQSLKARYAIGSHRSWGWRPALLPPTPRCDGLPCTPEQKRTGDWLQTRVPVARQGTVASYVNQYIVHIDDVIQLAKNVDGAHNFLNTAPWNIPRSFSAGRGLGSGFGFGFRQL